jgi:hypothetical protein
MKELIDKIKLMGTEDFKVPLPILKNLILDKEKFLTV